VGLDVVVGSNIKSASAVIVQNGSAVALPYRSMSRSQAIPMKKNTNVSEYK